jgi:DNA-binding transcriptional MerR regulator
VQENATRRLELLRPGEAADHLKVSRRTLQAWRSLGTGPAWHRVGTREVRYDRLEIESFVRKGARH